MAPKEQKALAITYKGGPFTLIRHAIPTPGAGELLVRVEGVGLNPAEWKVQTGVFDLPMTYPALLGTDGAGTVVGIGEGVTTFREGDRILFQGWFDAKTSSFQEYALVDANLTAKIPETMSSLEASAIPLALATAALGLGQEFPDVVSQRGGAGLKPFWEEGAEGYYTGKPILILGGASMVGQYTIQIAKYMGFSPIIVTSSLKHTAYLKSMGATHIIDRYVEAAPAVEKLKRELKIELEVVYDAVHAPITQAEVDLVSPNGTLVSIWELPKDGELQFKDGRRATANFGSVQMYKDLGKQMYARMEHFLEQGIIKPPRVEKLAGGLGGVAEGSARLQRNEVSGVKLVVDPVETPDF
ncbi:chaperonin 10-like protein [Mycena rosella]|uniref:Chaperonin 10-like protein n=1 Tax=Mycena rosella TaxID=1033263 RepID=A0AAD7MBD4_MYCRO|nr:chaperonin 10-like protein [Mycena rosella]